MSRADDILNSIAARKSSGEPFALATVVRTVAATAAKAGAKAVILRDGTISEGWVGGGCARAAVLQAARDALADGKSRLVSVQPPDELEGQGHKPGEEQGGVRFAKNMCPSQAIRLWQIMPSHRRFPAPWSAEEYNDVCYIVRDHDGQALACGREWAAISGQAISPL